MSNPSYIDEIAVEAALIASILRAQDEVHDWQVKVFATAPGTDRAIANGHLIVARGWLSNLELELAVLRGSI